ncbi:MAG TPA: hypothetical protein VKM54_07060 [Myxococcota bacterium]|nr:hypothetical protein [Myxococcota bacterium]
MQAAQRRAEDELGSFAKEFGAQPYSFPEFALETVYSLESEKAIENLGGLVAARLSVLDVTRSGETYTVILGPQFGSGYLVSLACTREQAEQLVAAPKDVRAGGYLVVARIQSIGRVPLIFEAEEGSFHVSVNKSDAPMLYKGTLSAEESVAYGIVGKIIRSAAELG